MTTYTGTANNDSWNLITPGTFTLDGLGGTDTLNLGTTLRSAYSITKASDGSVHVDSISGASAGLHATLKNMEVLTFGSGSDVLDLTTYFGPPPDTTPPTASSFSPASGATGVSLSSDIIVTFSEAIQRGSGSIVLKNAAGATIETFDAAASSRLSISGTTLTINPTNDLANGTNYTVTFASGTVKDLAGNAYAGATTYNFTTAAATSQTGTAGNDIFHESAGNSSIDGGAGIDTVVYTGNKSAYTISATNGAETVVKSSGVDSLAHVERLQFADTKVAFDLDGNAGTTAKILGVVFGQGTSANPFNPAYVGIGLSFLDGGTSYASLMKLALDAVGATTNTAVVNLLWTNLFGAAPTAAQASPYVALLDSGAYTAGTLGVLAADLSINTDHINLVGLHQTGINYI